MNNTPLEITNELKVARNYKTQNNIYTNARTNELFYVGIQSTGKKKRKRDIVLNICEQIVDNKVAQVGGNKLTMTRTLDDIDEDNQDLQSLVNAINLVDKKNWDRLQMDAMNERVLQKGAISGLGVTLWDWDNNIKTGNTFVTQGDFKGTVLDAVDVYFANPIIEGQSEAVEQQDWIIVSRRVSVPQAKKIGEMNKASKTELEKIQGNKDTSYTAYSKNNNEQNSSDGSQASNVFVNFKYWKKDGFTWCCIMTEHAVLLKPTNLEITRYPIAIFPWKIREKFIYGEAETTRIIDNQKAANELADIRSLHAMLTGAPRIMHNKNMITGVTNAPGAVYAVNARPGDNLSNAISYSQPVPTTIDFDKSINDLLDRTRELKAINENSVGSSNPDNYRAIMAQQKAAQVPLSPIKKRFYRYLRDVGLIWQDYYANKYRLTRKVKDDEGNILEFNGEDIKDVYMKTSVDVGESLQHGEFMQMDAIFNLWDRGIVKDPLQVIERLPSSLIEKQQELIDSFKPEEVDEEDLTQLQQYVEGLSPEMQAEIANSPDPLAKAKEMMANGL